MQQDVVIHLDHDSYTGYQNDGISQNHVNLGVLSVV